MEPLTWTGVLGGVLNPILFTATAVFLIAVIAQIALSFFTAAQTVGDMLIGVRGPADYAGMVVKWSFAVVVATLLAYLVGGILVPGIEAKGIIGAISTRLLPVWIALVVVFAASIVFKQKLGLYGKLFDSPVGMVGFGLVMFWVFTGLFAAMDLIITHEPLTQVSGMKNKVPGTPLAGAGEGDYAYYLL
ncbi:MAG: ABC transporter permease, partial [Pseudomonadota bacterium]